MKNLDPALLRSGRFDKKIYFDIPNVEERKMNVSIIFKNVALSKNISFKILAERTAGMSGADISNIANQAKILEIRSLGNKNKQIILF